MVSFIWPHSHSWRLPVNPKYNSRLDHLWGAGVGAIRPTRNSPHALTRSPTLSPVGCTKTPVALTEGLAKTSMMSVMVAPQKRGYFSTSLPMFFPDAISLRLALDRDSATQPAAVNAAPTGEFIQRHRGRR